MLDLAFLEGIEMIAYNKRIRGSVLLDAGDIINCKLGLLLEKILHWVMYHEFYEDDVDLRKKAFRNKKNEVFVGEEEWIRMSSYPYGEVRIMQNGFCIFMPNNSNQAWKLSPNGEETLN